MENGYKAQPINPLGLPEYTLKPFNFAEEVKKLRYFSDEIALTPKEREFLPLIVQKLSKIKSVRYVVLYGSKARGDWDDGSDVDILVVVDDQATTEDTEQITIENINTNIESAEIFSCLVSRIGDLENFRSIYPTMLSDIFKEGIILYSRK